ncbi:MAG: Mut7-C RNAse domain-containing protein [Candidatus Micrarchaeota archaeon]
MRFLADVMLQRLARWLRLLGLFVEQPNATDDDEIILHCSKNDLILLTRDSRMSQKAMNYCRCFLVKPSAIEEQILAVCIEFGVNLSKIKPEDIPSEAICSMCNGELKKVPRLSVKARVPPNSYKHSKKFWFCTTCKKIYWEGSHNKKIQQEFKQLQKLQKRKNQTCGPEPTN